MYVMRDVQAKKHPWHFLIKSAHFVKLVSFDTLSFETSHMLCVYLFRVAFPFIACKQSCTQIQFTHAHTHLLQWPFCLRFILPENFSRRRHTRHFSHHLHCLLVNAYPHTIYRKEKGTLVHNKCPIHSALHGTYQAGLYRLGIERWKAFN